MTPARTLPRPQAEWSPGDHAIDDRLAVLRFTGLEVGRVDPRLDEVAFGIDPEQPQGLADDLPADDEGGIEAGISFSCR